MRISSDAVATLITIFMIARRRGITNLDWLQPIMQSVVERGYGPDFRRFLDEMRILLNRFEAEAEARHS